MLALPEEKGKKHAIGNIALFVEPLSTWTEVFLPSPSMGEGEGEAGATPQQATPSPPSRPFPARGEGEASLYKNICPST